MRYIPLLVFFLCVSVSAQVTGDKAKKTYWPVGCSEIWLIQMRDSVTFPTAADAEKDGYKKADKCSTTVSPGADYRTGSPEPKSQKIIDLRRKSTSLTLVEEEISKYRNKTVRVIGNLRISDHYLGEFGRMSNKYWAFDLSSTTGGSGIFYMVKNETSEGYREWTVNPDLLYADCQVRILGLAKLTEYSSLELGGDLLGCKFWTRADDDSEN